MKRGKEVTLAEIKAMRDRIRKELSKDRSQNTKGRINPVKSGPSTHYDIKLGPGGIEELEFAVQYLQLRHCHNNPDLLVQGTLDAIKRLGKKGFLRPENVSALTEAYVFFRTVEAVLRLRNETVLKSGSSTVKGVSDFMGLSEDSFIKSLEGKKTETSNFWNSLE